MVVYFRFGILLVGFMFKNSVLILILGSARGSKWEFRLGLLILVLLV